MESVSCDDSIITNLTINVCIDAQEKDGSHECDEAHEENLEENGTHTYE